jgi:hypothetical protein
MNYEVGSGVDLPGITGPIESLAADLNDLFSTSSGVQIGYTIHFSNGSVYWTYTTESTEPDITYSIG